MNFDSNTASINRKCQSRIYCLQKLRKLDINSTILQNFYRAFLESVLTFGFICWFGSINVHNRDILNRIVKVGSKIVGQRQIVGQRIVRMSSETES